MAEPVAPPRVTIEDAVAAALAEVPPDAPATEGADNVATEPGAPSVGEDAVSKGDGPKAHAGKREDGKGASEGEATGEAGGAETAGDSVDDAAERDRETQVEAEPAEQKASDPEAELEDVELDALLKKHMPAQYAQAKRRMRQVERREMELDTRETQLGRMTDRVANLYDEMDRGDVGAVLKSFCSTRGRDFGEVLTQLNRSHLGMGTPATKEAAEAGETSTVRRELADLKRELAAEREERTLTVTLRRALDHGKEKYPHTVAADPLAVETDAIAVYRHLRAQLRRDPTAEEVFGPVEEKYEFEAFKAQKRAPASAPKSQMANGSRPNPAAAEQTVTPGNGAPKANARSVESPGTISNSIAERSGATKQLASSDARREAAVEEALRGMRTG